MCRVGTMAANVVSEFCLRYGIDPTEENLSEAIFAALIGGDENRISGEIDEEGQQK